MCILVGWFDILHDAARSPINPKVMRISDTTCLMFWQDVR